MELTRREFMGAAAGAGASALVPTLARAWSETDVEEYAELVAAAARRDFWVYRQVVNPGMKVGWWQKEIAAHLEDFYCKWQRGERPVMVIQAPPQHGKSKQVEDFISWSSGINPDTKFMYTSYSNDLGVRCNMGLQRTYDSKMYQNIFPNTRINESNVVTVAGRFLRNSHFLEYVDRKGSFRNTTVGGPITGMTLDFGVIDDPIKGRAEAQSEVTRDSVWSWLTDDFFSRFSEHAAMLMIMTRWHHDDPVGRFIEKHQTATVLRYPAIAEVDDVNRRRGAALFPEHKSLDFLAERRSVMTSGSWESLYQQNPSVQGGDMFPIEKFGVTVTPARNDIKRSVRYWDKAGSVDSGAYTVGVLMHELHSHEFVVADVVRGQWGALQREERIRQCCEIDNSGGQRVETWVEQEPGSGGKESAEGTVRNLRGFKVFADRVTGKKEVRAEPYAAQVQGSNVKLIGGARWIRPFLEEHETFPHGKYKDQVDAAGGAFAKLTTRSSYDSTMSWVG